MRKLITTMALLWLAGASAAIAQTTAPTNPTAPPLGADKQLTGTAPVGHRQPRTGDVPSENYGSGDPRHLDAEEKLLDQKMNGICRGC